jgi:hypothetical protein
MDSHGRDTRNKPSSVAFQRSLLRSKELWNLPGISCQPVTSRTRNGGNGRPSFDARKKWMFNEPESSEASDDEDLEDEEVNEELIEIAGPAEIDDDDDEEEEEESAKPSATRAILEVDGLMETLKKHCRCPDCNGPLKPSMKSIALASRLILVTCENPECCYVCNSKAPMEATIGSEDLRSRDRTTDYAINVLYVLGFISMGDGCTEGARLLALLGLPNAYTMESRTFTIIEAREDQSLHQEAYKGDIAREPNSRSAAICCCGRLPVVARSCSSVVKHCIGSCHVSKATRIV